MSVGVGQGSIAVSQKTEIPIPATVTAANQGLSLSGTTVQLGAASILSALPVITATRHIPITAGGIQLNSSNVATPNSTNLITPAAVTLTRTNGAGSLPQFTINDTAVLGVSFQIAPNTSGDTQLLHNNNTTATSQLRLRSFNVNSFIQLRIGTGIAGNTFLQVANRIVTIGDVGNIFNSVKVELSDTAQYFRLLKGLQVFVDFDVNANTYAMGDISAATNGTSLRVEPVSNRVVINRTTVGNVILRIGATTTATGVIEMVGVTSGAVVIQTQAAAGAYNFNLPITSGAAGDILTSGGGAAVPMAFVAPSQLAGLQMIGSGIGFTNNAGALLGTLGNSPTLGDPTKWIPINDNGTIRNIPAW